MRNEYEIECKRKNREKCRQKYIERYAKHKCKQYIISFIVEPNARSLSDL